MRILVIDDTAVNLKSAQQTLSGHDVTVCASYDEALNFLYHDTEVQKRAFGYQRDGLKTPYVKAMNETGISYWDAVLCDLRMPAGRDALGGEGMKFIGQEVPVGWSLALVAVEYGAKYAAVVSDMNHHSHPSSAMLDRLKRHIFFVDQAKMLLTNHVSRVGITGTEFTCTTCGGSRKDGTSKCWSCNGTGTNFTETGKDWSEILERLIKA